MVLVKHRDNFSLTFTFNLHTQYTHITNMNVCSIMKYEVVHTISTIKNRYSLTRHKTKVQAV